jgi:outer membrane lipoprotein-sorting protein
MKKVFLLLCFASFAAFAQYKTGEDLLRAMHKKYAGNYCKTVQFEQKTTRYVDDLVTDTAYWYEWISYPDKFRIDFGTKYGGNCVIFKHDSVYNYKKHQLVKTGHDENDLLLILGGMYFRKFENVIVRLKKQGYDLSKIQSLSLNGQDCFVIGAEDSHRIWVDKKDLKVIGLKTKLNEKDWLEIYFDAFQKSCKGFTETKVTAKKNGKLEQLEEYQNIKTSIVIPDSLFNKK